MTYKDILIEIYCLKLFVFESCRPPVIKVTDKVMIPQEEHPDINFVGLLIGPRGNTLKNLEKEVTEQMLA